MRATKIEVISKELCRIAKEKRTQRILDMLHDSDHFGWEKWLQVELATRLQKKSDIYFEDRNRLDLRKKKPYARRKNFNAFIDLVFREKGDLNGVFTAVELKLKRSEQGLRAVLGDLTKIKDLTRKNWPFRSVVCVLVHGATTDKKNSKYRKLSDELVRSSLAQRFRMREFTALVIGWNQNLTQNMTAENYGHWFKHVSELFRKYDVRVRYE